MASAVPMEQFDAIVARLQRGFIWAWMLLVWGIAFLAASYWTGSSLPPPILAGTAAVMVGSIYTLIRHAMPADRLTQCHDKADLLFAEGIISSAQLDILHNDCFTEFRFSRAMR